MPTTKNNYRIRDDYIIERWYYQHVQQGITMMEIQQQGNIYNHDVVFDCLDGYAVCMNDK